MKIIVRVYFFSCFILMAGCATEPKEEWIELFNGNDLSGWKANESAETFKVVNGVLVANGLRSHLFYVGDDDKPDVFKNFELNFDAMTHHLANSGVYFHTAHQKEGWLETGYELQINTSHQGEGGYKEVKKSGSLYGVRNLYMTLTRDSVWHHFSLLVDGKRIQIRIDEQLVVDYLEPASTSATGHKKVLSSGAFALQGHDPESTVFFKNIRVKKLPDRPEELSSGEVAERSRVLEYQAKHFAFIDYNIPIENKSDSDAVLRAFYNSGINAGIVLEMGKIDRETRVQKLTEDIEAYDKLPVFLGILKSNSSSFEGVTESVLSRFDYVIGDLTQFKNREGQPIDIMRGINIGDPGKFMDDYVNATIGTLDEGQIDIWAMATVLPESLSGDYNELWTPERMTNVIDALKRNGVAIEVHNQKRIPSIAFIKLAKAKGCLFTAGGLYTGSEMSEPDYFYEAIDQCGLDYKDIYIAGGVRWMDGE